MRSLLLGGFSSLVFAALTLLDRAEDARPALALMTVLAVIGVMICAALLRAYGAQARESRQESGFDALFSDTASPVVLTDRDGVILAANRASGISGEQLGGAYLGDELASRDGEARAACYRALRALEGADSVAESLGEAGRKLQARRLPGGKALWTLDRAPDLAPLDDEAAPFAAADLDRSGAVLRFNRAWRLMSEADQRETVARALAALTAGRGYARAEIDGAPMTLALTRLPQGGARVVVGPARLSRLETLDVALARSAVAILRLSPSGEIRAINAAGTKLLGEEARVGRALGAILEGLARPLSGMIQEAMAGGAGVGPELARLSRGEGTSYLQLSLARISDAGETGILAVLNDATELKSLEQQFVQSQKMQAVGQLAGGVAHDFNNLLTAILGHCDLLMMRTDQSAPDFADLTQIRQNAKRAAALVRQLLAFSRKQTLRPTAVRVDDSLGELLHLLNRLLGEKVTMRLKNDADLWPVWIDSQQFEQVIINLVVNARDAMPNGGEVTLRCFNTTFASDFARDRAVVPAGDYVCIEVQDSGCGIRPERLGQVFEPFFTTKKQGEGTGLGLSTAYGIVKQTGGFIFVDSEVGEGTVFTIYLPRHEEEPEATRAPDAGEARRDLTGTGRILLVEDEAPVRSFASRALRMRGYAVIEAEDAESALEALADETLEIDLMVSDVVMPGMDGPTAARLARETRPDLRLIFMSGYAEDVFRRGVEGVEPYSFLPKPFTLEELAEAVKTALATAENRGDGERNPTG